MMAAGQKETISNFAIIVLAAGGSKRLEKPKQLLIYRGKTLLQNVLDVATSSHAHPVVVVLGANSDLVEDGSRDDKNIVSILNDSWNEGISSSIRCGVEYLMHQSPSTERAILMVCDQPFITAELVNDLIRTQHNTGKPIVASSYGDTVGTPALFHRSFFGELMDLTGDAGAKKIILEHPGSFATVSFPLGNIDIDSVADLEGLGRET